MNAPTTALPKPTAAHARTVWRERGKPSFRALEKYLREGGYAISYSHLRKMKDGDEQWRNEYRDYVAATGIAPERIIGAIEEAVNVASAYKPAAFVGIKAQLVGRLFAALKEMPLNTMDDWHRAMDGLDRIDNIIHTIRGGEIAGKEKPADIKSGIIARLEPKMAVAPFQKTGSAS